jgi:hypothetical protein
MPPLTPHAELSGRFALLAGLTAALVAAAFGYHTVYFLDYPSAGLYGGGLMLGYLAAGIAFQFGVPVLCLAAFIFGTPARRSWTARIGMACAAAALAGYALYVRGILEMIGE